MLYLIGLGLDWKDLSLKAIESIHQCSEVYLESYTSVSNFSVSKLSKLLGKKVIALNRKQTEESRLFMKNAGAQDIALLIYGDPLAATTHAEILQEAKKKKIKIKLIHSSSIFTAVAETGLMLYKLGKTASIPIPEKNFKAESFFSILKENQSIGAHTLFLLDLKPEQSKFLKPKQAIKILLEIAKKQKYKGFDANSLCIACSQLGMAGQKIIVGKAKDLLKKDFGVPPYCLIIPGKLHFMEEDLLKTVS